MFFYKNRKSSIKATSVTNSSWKDFRTTAGMYFLKGNRFLIDLRTSGHSVHRFQGAEGSEDLEGCRYCRKYHLPEPKMWSFRQLEYPRPGVLIFSSGYCLSLRMTLTHPNRCTECRDASKILGNQLPVKKYIGAMVRKSFQLEFVAETDAFENLSPCQILYKENYH